MKDFRDFLIDFDGYMDDLGLDEESSQVTARDLELAYVNSNGNAEVAVFEILAEENTFVSDAIYDLEEAQK